MMAFSLIPLPPMHMVLSTKPSLTTSNVENRKQTNLWGGVLEQGGIQICANHRYFRPICQGSSFVTVM